ncbi:hypothetical protein ANCCEY_02323 [Ancylostoma ceylanicum]|uniref:Tc1-like transposase DDE domain-containing protein n=1 Tax=Ancylostoma ceylanicum TaxID=53326 RepID=A0A0D6M516_9BILA|nr:hypothetical protein ANCCEY_02323 [Ancylostoma ceylanicum]
MDALPGKNGRLVVSRKNRQARMRFARTHLHWTSEDWCQKSFFSDESKFNRLGSDGPRYVRRRLSEEFDPKCIRGTVQCGGGSVMVWGAMRRDGLGPVHRIEAIMDKNVCVDILKNRPAQSPDLNPIENLWIDVNEAIKREKPKNIKELYETIENAWYDIPTERCQKLVDSMPRRCAAVIKSEGERRGKSDKQRLLKEWAADTSAMGFVHRTKKQIEEKIRNEFPSILKAVSVCVVVM